MRRIALVALLVVAIPAMGQTTVQPEGVTVPAHAVPSHGMTHIPTGDGQNLQLDTTANDNTIQMDATGRPLEPRKCPPDYIMLGLGDTRICARDLRAPE